MRRVINLYFSSITPSDVRALVWAWLSAIFRSSPKRRERFEKQVAGDMGQGLVLLFGSARSALFACLESAGIGPGDQVIVTGFTCLAVPLAVVATGAEPVYVDIDPRSLNADPSLIRSKIGSRVRALIVQHTFGCPAISEVIVEARQRGILTIEDCALAIGSTKNGQPVGMLANAAVFSLELSKTITTGWGGILVVHDEKLKTAVARYYDSVPEPPPLRVAQMIFQTALSGFLYDARWYHACRYIIFALFKSTIFRASTPPEELDATIRADFLHRLSGPQATLGWRLWSRLPQITARIGAVRDKLSAALRECGYESLASPTTSDVSRGHRIPFLVSDRPAAVAWFAAAGIELGTWFDAPISPAPPNRQRFSYDPQLCPHALWISRHVVNLPAHVRLKDGDVKHIIETLRSYRDSHPADAGVQPSMTPWNAAAREEEMPV